jgi:hypothetical protein
MKIVFWNAPPCSLVDIDRRFGGVSSVITVLVAASSSEKLMSVTLHDTTPFFGFIEN